MTESPYNDLPIELTVQTDGTPEGTKLVDLHSGREVAGLQVIDLGVHFTSRPFVLNATVQFVLYGEPGTVAVNIGTDLARALQKLVVHEVARD